MSVKQPASRGYQKLLNKLFLQILILLAGAVVIVVGVRFAFRGQFANGIVRLICRVGQVEWEQGLILYQIYIRNNLDLIVGVAIILFFLILLRLAMMLFNRYFDQIVAGVDQLASETDQPIVMSPELDFMSDKLNEVQSRLRQRTQQAQAAEQRKNDLVVYLAHDIKTPLTSVIGYLSLLDESPDMPGDQRTRYIHIALEKAGRLETLINEFFEITRYRFQSVPLHCTQVDLCYMMVQLADEMYPVLTSHRQTMALDVPEELTIWADSDKMARVFNNILKNAAAYGEPGQPIRVSARQSAKQVVIRFENQGVIPREQLDSIFEKFFRLDSARSTATGGAGLGLAIARDIVRLHAGDVSAGCVDGKTIFTVVLPQTEKPAQAAIEKGA